MSISLLATKLYFPPARPSLVSRPLLVDRLQAGLHGPLTLVSAPAGSGKTTLLCEWRSGPGSGMPVAWLSLDNDDNDIARFLVYLTSTLSVLKPGFGESTLTFLQSPQLPPTQIILTALINDLVNALSAPYALVLDDYHMITSQLVHDAMTYLLDHLPAQMHLVLLTRADPALPLPRLRARGQLTEIRAADLRFTVEEATAFLNQIMGLTLSEKQVEALEQRTEGWIAGLQLAALSMQGREDVEGFLSAFTGSHHYIVDYLAEEVLARQPEAVREFLMKTSILERLTAPLCDVLTDRADGQAMLEKLEHANLFLVPLDDERGWYRYHHLFGDLLKYRLRQTFPELSVNLHQRASTWYAAKHDLENAITHALAAHDFESAAKLIEKVIHNLDTHCKHAMLMSWFNSLPREILEIHPLLCVYRAWGNYFIGHRNMVEEWLLAAEKAIDRIGEENPEKRHIQGRIAAIRALLALHVENVPGVLEMGQKALDLLPESDSMIFDTGIALGAAYWGLGDVNQAVQAYKMSKAAGLKINNSSMGVESSCYLGTLQIKQGQLKEALATFFDALHLATLPNGYEIPAAGFPNMKLGDMYREWNDMILAAQYLNRGMEQSIQYNQPDGLTEAYVCLGRYQLAVGDVEATHETLQKADWVAEHTKVDPFILCWLDDCRLKAWLADGNLEAANLWAHNSGLSLDEPFKYLHDLNHLNLARILVARGTLTDSISSHEQAVSLLARLQNAAEHAGWVHEQIKILVLQAVNFQAYSKNEAALQKLIRAAILAEPGGYVRVFVDEGEILRGLLVILRKKLQEGRPTDLNRLGVSFQEEQLASMLRYITRLQATFNQIAGRTRQRCTGSSSVEQTTNDMIEPLSERELEILRLVAEGKSNQQVAEALILATGTVKKHLNNIFGKLGVQSRTQCVARARELNLL